MNKPRLNLHTELWLANKPSKPVFPFTVTAVVAVVASWAVLALILRSIYLATR